MCSVLHEAARARKKCREKLETWSSVSPHSFICFIIKNSWNFPHITFNFQNKLHFQSEQRCRRHARHKARYHKPIRILVRMVPIIWLVEQDQSCKNVKVSRFTICSSLQTEIVRQVDFNTFALSFLSLLYRICIWNSPWIVAHKTTQVFSHDN